MAFPVVESTTSTGFSSTSTTHAVDYPSTVDSGDLLVMVFAANDGAVITTPSGYTELDQDEDPPTVAVRVGVFVKSAAGTEGGGSETVTIDASKTAAAQIIRVTGWSGTIATDIDISTAAIGSSSTPDPDSVSAGWGSADNLFITVVGAGDDDATVTSFPTNYGGGSGVISGGGGNNGCTVGSCYRSLASTTDDPGIFNLSEAEAWVSWTLVVAPTGAGGTNPMMMKNMQESHLNG